MLLAASNFYCGRDQTKSTFLRDRQIDILCKRNRFLHPSMTELVNVQIYPNIKHLSTAISTKFSAELWNSFGGHRYNSHLCHQHMYICSRNVLLKCLCLGVMIVSLYQYSEKHYNNYYNLL